MTAAAASVPTVSNNCGVDGCRTTIGLTTFAVAPETLARLGYAAGDAPLVARACTFHYLMAMSAILARFGLPRAEPVSVPPSAQRDPLVQAARRLA